jgi:hypothetical protein
MAKQTTFLDPSYERTRSGHRKIDGVQFNSYHTGIMSYAMISSNGMIIVWESNARRHGARRYNAKLIDYGYVKAPSGEPKRFHTEEAAMRAAVKIIKGPDFE